MKMQAELARISAQRAQSALWSYFQNNRVFYVKKFKYLYSRPSAIISNIKDLGSVPAWGQA
jgi:hypothetical protein